ncbi:LysM peptidoglycan-binding domain-containing protein, partial [Staphylococcus pettenkoferi]
KFKTTTAKLQKMNKIKNANAIQAGQTLKVPSAKAPKPKKTSKTQKYTIKNGDTLGGIANKFKTTTSYLQELNKIKNPNTIQAGKTIKVPKQGTTKPSKKKKPSKTNTNSKLKYLNSLVGKGIDFDNAYGYQCVDVANHYWAHLFNHGLKGNAIDIPNANNFKGEAKVYNNTPNFEAKPGDLVVFTNGQKYGSGFGHVAVVTNGNVDGNLQKFESLEQNWYGGGLNKTEKAHKVTHNYESQMVFIRPLK